VATVEDGGLVLYNGGIVPEDCERPGVRMVAAPFTEIADRLGASKVGNVVMLGALLELTGVLPEERIIGALRRLVKTQKWFELDVKALEAGRDAVRTDDTSLWGV
jgi:Pyruvate/2-oxoacid:ferredoxin oxidoreductase gamma subunit